MLLLNISNWNFRMFSVFPAFEERMKKFFGKNTMTF